MANDYDKILKENVLPIFLPFMEKFLGIRTFKSEVMKDKLQITQELETDFIQIVQTTTGEKFILHLEFQSTDHKKMIHRMLLYYGMLKLKHRLPIKQIVIYLGEKPTTMRTTLSAGEPYQGSFTLLSLRDYSYENFLSSNLPEEVILTILSNFEGKNPQKILKGIFTKLKQISENEIALRKYIQQLSVLARLRNLTLEVQKQIKNMGLTYNITNDVLYKEGKKEGQKELIIEMLKDGTLSIEKIASLAKVSVDYVKQVAKELKK